MWAVRVGVYLCDIVTDDIVNDHECDVAVFERKSTKVRSFVTDEVGSIERVYVAVRDMPSSPVTSCVASSVGRRVSDVPVSVSVGVPSVSVIEPLAVCPTSVGEPMRVVDGVWRDNVRDTVLICVRE